MAFPNHSGPSPIAPAPSPSSEGVAPPPPYSELFDAKSGSSAVVGALHPAAPQGALALRPETLAPQFYPQQHVQHGRAGPQSYVSPNPQPYPQLRAPSPGVRPGFLPPQGPSQPPFAPHPHFGPTPINDVGVLPYAFYREEAMVDARARSRFCEALLCAIGIYLGAAFLLGAEILGDGSFLRILGVDVVVRAAS